MAGLTSLSSRGSQQRFGRILSYPVSSVIDSDDEQDGASDTATVASATTATTAATANTATTAANAEPCRDRPLTMMRREMTRPAEFSTVVYESQAAKEESEYEVLWTNVMNRPTYRGSATYTNAKVLLLCWADNSNDLATNEEVSKLSNTFQERFNFHTQIEYLDMAHESKLQVQVNAKVAYFIYDHDGPRTHLIVYYAGHGRPGSYYGNLELFGQKSTNKDERRHLDTLVWNKTEQLLKEAEADVLEIFDCCYAGNLGLTGGEQGTFEYLAATQDMCSTPVPGKSSFTSALIWALEALADEKVEGRFTTEELLKKITSHAPNFPRGQTPVLSARNTGSSTGRIMLYPLQKAGSDTPSNTSSDSGGALSRVDLAKQSVLTLHFKFDDKPTLTDIELLGKEVNSIFERNALGVNRVRWGGIRQ